MDNRRVWVVTQHVTGEDRGFVRGVCPTFEAAEALARMELESLPHHSRVEPVRAGDGAAWATWTVRGVQMMASPWEVE